MISKVERFRISAIVYGVVAGLLAVGVQIFFGLEPPPAYAICMTCHPRDMISWLVNHTIGLNWEIAPVSAAVPLLTTVGLLIGAHIAARHNHEVRPMSLGREWRSFLCGLLVMNAGLLVLGCPTRLLLLSAYGELLAVIAVVGVVVGILLGTLLLARGIFY
jgi:hypothetical protein